MKTLRNFLAIFLTALFGGHILPLARTCGAVQVPESKKKEEPKSKTLTVEEKLTAAESDLTTAQADLLSMTGKRDTLQGTVDSLTTERDNLQSQFESLEATSKQHKLDLDAARSTIGTLTVERDSEIALNQTAAKNITRLESLCNLKGIDPNQAVPEDNNPGGNDKESRIVSLQEEMKTADPTQKTILARKLRTIRDEE